MSRRWLSRSIVLVLPFLIAASLGVSIAQAFSDVTSFHPRAQAIFYLKDKGVIGGYPDGTFQPDREVNRAEALKILLEGGKFEITTITTSFPDVRADAWFAKYVGFAKTLGIVSGYPDGTFKPERTINRAEAMKMVLKAAQFSESVRGESTPFSDVPSSAWFYPFVDEAYARNLIDTSAQFDGGTNITRGDLAEMMYRVMALKEEGGTRFDPSKIKNYIPTDPADVVAPAPATDVTATFYSSQLEGKSTSSGEKYASGDWTAAYLGVPLKSYVQVIKKDSGESTIVRVNDRNSSSTNVDLSKSAFSSIAPSASGSFGAQVISVLAASFSDPKMLYSVSSFKGITLDEPLPSYVVPHEVRVLTGKAGAGSIVTAFYADETGKQKSFSTKVKPDGSGAFALSIQFPLSGTVDFTMIPGDAGTGVVVPIHVASEPTQKAYPKAAPSDGPAFEVLPQGVTVTTSDISKKVFRLGFYQGSRSVRYIVMGKDLARVEVSKDDFTSFAKGYMTVALESAYVSTPFSHDRSSSWSPVTSKQVTLTEAGPEYMDDAVVASTYLPDIVNQGDSLSLSATSSIQLEDIAYLTRGDMTVDQVVVSKTGSNGAFSLSFSITQGGITRLEVVAFDGKPLVNHTMYPRNTMALISIQSDIDDNQINTEISNMTQSRERMLYLVNQIRKEKGLGELTIDTKLTQLAQWKADDMAKRDYFAHKDPDGQYADDRKSMFGITSPVGENLAKDYSVDQAFYGLRDSGIHLQNMMDPVWGTMGVGYAKAQDGTLLAVQIFTTKEFTSSDSSSSRNDFIQSMRSTRPDLSVDSSISQVCTDWIAKMKSESFLGLTSKTGEKLTDKLLSMPGNISSFKVYVNSDATYEGLKKTLLANAELQNSAWKIYGVDFGAAYTGGVASCFVLAK